MNWANMLTALRLVSIIPLSVFAYVQLTGWFLVFYAFAILTDLFDGMVARAQGLASPKGADFDGTIDLLFSAAALWWLWLLVPELIRTYSTHLLVVGAFFIIFFAASLWKRKKIVMPHLWLGKLAMLLFGLLVPIALLVEVPAWAVWTVVLVVILSRIEMTLFVLAGREDMDAKSFFFRNTQVLYHPPTSMTTQVVDVRTPEEYAKGHLPEAINIPHNEFIAKAQRGELDKNVTYHLYCRSGGRVGMVLSEVQGLSLESVQERFNAFAAERPESL